MNLSDNDKRDVVKLIESGKPLPDKYRFLLFEDKREVELTSRANEFTPDHREIAVKIADIFGNDTVEIMEV